jgi:hypothetical protein
MNAGTPHAPPITDAMRESARRQPGTWLYAVDPFFDDGSAVPPHGVVGAWRVDQRGEITGEFEANPNYRPSPIARGFPPPTDPLDRLIQLIVSGYAEKAELTTAVASRELTLFSRADGSIFTLRRPDGVSVVQAFTSAAHRPTGCETWTQLRGDQLASLLPDHHLELNPQAAASIRIALRDVPKSR